ncbi:MAG: type III-B CRISPR module-associated protein Cmr3, partial [Candidatus Micrarchaeota archaeon]|nr:type III-B CRISPR module-associated protein Cmr3 [Candidatus Micrarchaeota archaeon]
VIGKPIRIGGWDMLNRSPKRMYKAIPAGSVYYFRVLNKCSWKDILDYFHFKNISDVEREKGFGLSFVGIVKP